MAILLVAFTFLVVIYLMNLFIGLLNMEIENYHNKSEMPSDPFISKRLRKLIEPVSKQQSEDKKDELQPEDIKDEMQPENNIKDELNKMKVEIKQQMSDELKQANLELKQQMKEMK